MNKEDKNLLRLLFLITGIGFIVYWTVTCFKWIPKEYLFRDYSNPLTVSWNRSFFPLDLLISFTGLTPIYLMNLNNDKWRIFVVVSSAFTISSGLQTISYWIIQSDFDLSRWIPNLYLLCHPIYFLQKLLHYTEN